MIDAGLNECDYGVVILSQSFFSKRWPREELDGLVAREVIEKRKIVLPVWYGVSPNDVSAFSPSLAGKLATSFSEGVGHVASQIKRAIDADPRQLMKRMLHLQTPAGGVVRALASPNIGGPIDEKRMEEFLESINDSFQEVVDKAFPKDAKE